MSSHSLLAAIVLASISATGCIEHALSESLKRTEFAIPDPAPPEPPTEGAIWRGVTQSGSFLYYDRKARGLGDLVTVVILEDLRAEGSANTTLDGKSSLSANLTSDIGFTDVLQKGAGAIFDLFGLDGLGGNAPAGQEVNAISGNRESGFEGDGATNRQSRFRGVVTCRIVEVLPGGVFRVYGRREIIVNHELQLVSIDGLVRRQDIGIDNQVASSQLAEAKLTFDGIGVIDDKQRPSLVARALDWLYPF